MGRERAVIKQQATGAEIAGTALGLGLTAIHNARVNSAIANREAFDAAMAKGNFKQALTCAEAMASSRDSDIKGLGCWAKARALRYLGRPAEAIRAALTATQLGESSADAGVKEFVVNASQCELGWASLATGDAPTAITAFTRAIKMIPRDEEALSGRGIALRRLGNYEQSLHDFDLAVQINPGQKNHYLQRGQTYLEMGNSARARADFTQVTRLAADDFIGYQYLAKTYEAMGDHHNAIKLFTQALSLNPRDVETRRARAAAYRAIDDQANAKADLVSIEAYDKQAMGFQLYRDAAETIYGRGVTKTWNPADVEAKTSYKGTLVCCLIAAVGLLAYIISELSMSSSCLSLLVLAGFFAAFCIPIAFWAERSEARSNRKASRQYFDEMTAAEPQMPGFTEFFGVYLTARDKGELATLEQSTHAIFEKIALENPSSAETWQQAKAAVPAAPPPDAYLVPGAQPNTWQCSNCGGYVRSDARMCKHCRQPFKSAR
jgi:tetratricopeptide (TPR) repeat protein